MRIVAMLTRMALTFDGVAEAQSGSQGGSQTAVDYEHEHEGSQD